MAICYLALGSNLNSRFENILNAIKLLNKADIKLISHSSLYETTPYGYTEQPNFLNMVIKCSTNLQVGELLKVAKDIETSLGRTETIRWGPRIIDIDILLYENLILNTKELIIPHLELKKRDFFLVPLIEIEPLIIDPVDSKPLKEYISRLQPTLINRVDINLFSEKHHF